MRTDDRGATLVMVAGAMLMLLGVAAMAVDLAALRGDIRLDRLSTDAAATAGAIHILPSADSKADEACENAWDYLRTNLESYGAPADLTDCSGLTGTCFPDTKREASTSYGPYEVVISHPVPNGDDLMDGQPIHPVIDGGPCQRLAVEVTRTREYNFAPVIGFDSGETYVRSVARVDFNAGEPTVVPLLVLEPVACNALYTSGQGKVTVNDFSDTPGIIAVDSDGSGGSGDDNCNNGNRYTIDAKGNENGWIRAVPTEDGIPSVILSYALSHNPSVAYDSNDLTTGTGAIADDPEESWFRLYPRPTALTSRITRARIDHRYDCQTSYDAYLGVEIFPCTTGEPSELEPIIEAYGGSTDPIGFNVWTEDSGTSCSVGDETISVEGNWFVDCDGFVVNGGDVTFQDGDVVFQNGVELRSDGSLVVNTTDEDRIVYIRTGDLEKEAQSSIELNQTFVYLGGGRVDLGGGSGGLEWSAPIGGGFEDLALWAEADVEFIIGGQSGNDLTGTFFTPYANPFNLSGQGGQVQLSAQFVTRRLEVSGDAEVVMQPDPEHANEFPVKAVRLIR